MPQPTPPSSENDVPLDEIPGNAHVVGDVLRLRPDWPALLEGFGNVGPVVTMCRAGDVIFGFDGEFPALQDSDKTICRLTPHFAEWQEGWRWCENNDDEDQIDAFEICDDHGRGFLKVCQTAHSSADQWEKLTADFARCRCDAFEILHLRPTNHLSRGQNGEIVPASSTARGIAFFNLFRRAVRTESILQVSLTGNGARLAAPFRPTEVRYAAGWVVVFGNSGALHLRPTALDHLDAPVSPLDPESLVLQCRDERGETDLRITLPRPVMGEEVSTLLLADHRAIR